MKTLVGFLVVVVLLISCAKEKAPETASSSIDEAKTKEVLEHHLKAFQANDLEATLADYTEESILVTPDGPAKGLAEIRKGFEGAFTLFPKDSLTFTLTKTVISQDIALITWTAKTPKVEFPFATDTFIIRDGKIISQTFAGAMKPLK